jgi:hypothetical protein
MRNTPLQTAVLIAVMLKRSGQTRARISASTIKLVGIRKPLRTAFISDLRGQLAEFGWELLELGSGGFGAVQISSLEAAKPVTAKRYLSDAELRALKLGRLAWDELEREVDPDEDQSDPDQE